MYICRSCGVMFDEPGNRKSYLATTGDKNFYENIGVCPECRSEDYDEAVRCEECGEWFFPEELTDGLCVNCYGVQND